MRRWIWWAGAAALTALTLWAWPALRPAFSGGVNAASAMLGRTGIWGPMVVVGLQMLQAVISPLPAWPVTVAAGAQYGPVAGTLYCLVGGTLGAAINFALARRLGQPLVMRHLGQKWVDAAGKLTPLHFLILSLFGRLIPIASFDMVAYVAGIARISLPAFLGVAMVGQAPAYLAYAWFGSDLAAASRAGLASSALLILFVLLIAGGKRLWQRLAP